MKFATINGWTHAPGTPENWDPARDGTCGALPIRAEFHGDGKIACCKSAWRPSPEELAMLLRGGYVELNVAGWQVPVSLATIEKDGAS